VIVSVGDSFPQGWPLGDMVEPGSCAAEEPLFRSNSDVSPTPTAVLGADGGQFGISGRRIVRTRHGHGADGLPAPAPARRFVAISSGFAELERANHNVRRAIACAVAEYLQRAAEYLRQPRGVDVLLFGAARTAEVIDALDVGARQLGAELPDEVTASANRLREWAATLKQQTATARASDVDDTASVSPSRFAESP